MDVDFANIKIHANRFSRGLGGSSYLFTTYVAFCLVILIKQDNVARILYDIWDHEDGPETAKG